MKILDFLNSDSVSNISKNLDPKLMPGTLKYSGPSFKGHLDFYQGY